MEFRGLAARGKKLLTWTSVYHLEMLTEKSCNQNNEWNFHENNEWTSHENKEPVEPGQTNIYQSNTYIKDFADYISTMIQGFKRSSKCCTNNSPTHRFCRL